jgi:hypothetical protein
MEKEVIIKPIPRWWKHLPFIGTDLAFARYPYIYLPEHIHSRFARGELTFHDESIIVHETVHIHRQRKLGILVYFIKYLFSRKFRLLEELVAIREQMAFLKKHGQKYDFERKARQFASFEYFWVTSLEEGRIMLEGLWSEV